MRQIFMYDTNGKYVEPVLIAEDAELPEQTTEVAPPQPMFDPTFHPATNTWTDISEEEWLSKNPIPEPEKTEIEKLREALLRTQEALTAIFERSAG
ncbi:hypothetical protein [Listeria monocytogenes]|uniref:hypothetical protein n=1 Tax=Listeria monocytogenes TaxID=1639 RepID=UPI000873E5A7|nr:hypothetical protein [Listeria monocytogenes]EAC7998108.1 hypothetical protein [Listeria monocytogenes]EAC8350553.1 hypothetical protein [Listeria monocytogenes]EAD0739943.1 hypothetical protein [Listeria monocytogenes]EAD9140304.1 hypothetical protein [Listeria monocytogenes]EIL9239371.1 hypothetical protein [Listeria monocytogenes]